MPNALCCERLDEILSYFVWACTLQMAKRPDTITTTSGAIAETILAAKENNNKAYNIIAKVMTRRKQKVELTSTW